MTIHTYLSSTLGSLLATSREGNLTGLYFADQPHARIGRDWARQDEAEIFAKTERQLAEYASGERTRFDLPFKLSGTPFQIQVWLEIASIPFGKTLTYGELARRIGSSQAVRAVGTATGANPLLLIVPCHRVVGKNGTMTGYAGGLPRKRALLAFEAGETPGLLAPEAGLVAA